jgi:hypothetical protein
VLSDPVAGELITSVERYPTSLCTAHAVLSALQAWMTGLLNWRPPRPGTAIRSHNIIMLNRDVPLPGRVPPSISLHCLATDILIERLCPACPRVVTAETMRKSPVIAVIKRKPSVTQRLQRHRYYPPRPKEPSLGYCADATLRVFSGASFMQIRCTIVQWECIKSPPIDWVPHQALRPFRPPLIVDQCAVARLARRYARRSTCRLPLAVGGFPTAASVSVACPPP